MKKIKQIASISFLIFSTSFIYAQKTAMDSVCVQIENKAEMNLAIYSYNNLAENIEDDFSSLQIILKETKDIPEEISYTINYIPNKSLIIKQNMESERIVWKNGEQTKYQFNNQCNVTTASYYLQIRFNELEELISDSLIAQIMEVIDTTTNIQSRYSTIYNYSFEGMQLTHNQQFDKNILHRDMLSLSGGVGVNLIKNEPVIDISAGLALSFSKKRILKNQYYASYNLLFDFTGETTINVNGFLNIGYRNNASKKVNKSNWLGVELGYLVNRQGDLFEKNTFKLGVNWELGKYVSVSPQLYMSGDFNQFYPAIRIGFGF